MTGVQTCALPISNIITVFRREDLEVIRIGTFILRLQCFMLPVQAWTIMTNMLAQSVGYSGRASLIAISRQGLFYIPVLLILPNMIGLMGIQIAQPLADIFTFILSSIIIVTVLKDINKLKKEYNQDSEELKEVN